MATAEEFVDILTAEVIRHQRRDGSLPRALAQALHAFGFADLFAIGGVVGHEITFLEIFIRLLFISAFTCSIVGTDG